MNAHRRGKTKEKSPSLERRGDELLPWGRFYLRFAGFVGVTVLIIIASLAIGSVGYHHYGQLGWIDALHNSAMILTGMGPVDKMTTDAGKLFATFYALYSGVAFLTMMALLATPWIHRLLHTFHLDGDEDKS